MKVWVLVEFFTQERTYHSGSWIDLPYGTDAEQAEVDSLINFGIISTNKPDGVIT